MESSCEGGALNFMPPAGANGMPIDPKSMRGWMIPLLL